MEMWQLFGILVIGAAGLLLPFGFFDTHEKMKNTEEVRFDEDYEYETDR